MTPQPERAASEHSRHDPLLLASLAGGDDLATAERARVAAQLADCAACRADYADLVALTASLRADLPSLRRSRDFRITPAMAHDARRSPLRRWLDAARGFSAARPLAAAVCSIGLVLVLVGLALPGPNGAPTLSLLAPAAGGAAPAETSADQARNASPGATAAPADQSVPGATYGGLASEPPKAVAGAASLAPPAAGSLWPGAEGALGPTVPSTGSQASSGSTLGAGPVVAAAGLVLFLGGLGALFVARRRQPREEG